MPSVITLPAPLTDRIRYTFRYTIRYTIRYTLLPPRLEPREAGRRDAVQSAA